MADLVPGHDTTPESLADPARQFLKVLFNDKGWVDKLDIRGIRTTANDTILEVFIEGASLYVEFYGAGVSCRTEYGGTTFFVPRQYVEDRIKASKGKHEPAIQEMQDETGSASMKTL